MSDSHTEVFEREPLLKSISYAGIVAIITSFFLTTIFLILIVSSKATFPEWIAKKEVNTLLLFGIAVTVGVFLISCAGILYSYLRPPYSIKLSREGISFSKWSRRYFIAFDQLIGVEQKHRTSRTGFHLIDEYILYTKAQVVSLPIEYSKGNNILKYRLLTRNERLNDKKRKMLSVAAQREARISQSNKLTLVYRRIRTRQIVVDFEKRQWNFSEKKSLQANNVEQIIVNCELNQKSYGRQELLFKVKSGKDIVIKLKYYLGSDEEWFALLQNLHLAAQKLNIPLDVVVSSNRPLHLISAERTN